MLLELDLTTILLEIANFLLLTALLYRFVFRPLLARVAARTAEKEQLKRDMQRDREIAAQLRAEAGQQLESLDDRLSEILREARQQLEQERRDILDAARKAADQVIRQSQEETREVQLQQVEAFHEDLLGTITGIVGRLFSELAPAELHARMVEELNDRVWDMGRKEMDRVEGVRRSLSERDPTVEVTTAQPLQPEQQRRLVQTFSAVADQTVSFDIVIDPSLVAGLRIRMGDLLVENSIAKQLENLREQAAQAIRDKYDA